MCLYRSTCSAQRTLLAFLTRREKAENSFCTPTTKYLGCQFEKGTERWDTMATPCLVFYPDNWKAKLEQKGEQRACILTPLSIFKCQRNLIMYFLPGTSWPSRETKQLTLRKEHWLPSPSYQCTLWLRTGSQAKGVSPGRKWSGGSTTHVIPLLSSALGDAPFPLRWTSA